MSRNTFGFFGIIALLNTTTRRALKRLFGIRGARALRFWERPICLQLYLLDLALQRNYFFVYGGLSHRASIAYFLEINEIAILEPCKIADEIRKSPKGLSIAIERDASKKGPRSAQSNAASSVETGQKQ